MTDDQRRKIFRAHHYIDMMHMDAFLRGEVGEVMDEAALAQILGNLLDGWRNDGEHGVSTMAALSAILNALDGTDADYKLTLHKRQRRGPRQTTASFSKGKKHDWRVTAFVWREVSKGGRKKPIIGLAAKEFGCSDETIYASIRAIAALRRADLQDSNPLSQGFARRELREHIGDDLSDGFDKWLEDFAVARRKGQP